jgi:hypothetical protein
MVMRNPEASEAGRLLAELRWGRTRAQTLVNELVERRDQLRTEQVEQLRALVDAAGAKGN